MGGGPDAALIIDAPAGPKKGLSCVGVAPRQASMVGKNANCRTPVPLTRSSREGPVPLALRLVLPESWATDAVRPDRAGGPPERRTFRTRPETALEGVGRVLAAGVRFGVVLADAGYGAGAAFRRGPGEREVLWAVGVPGILKVHPADAAMAPPRPIRPRSRPRPCPRRPTGRR